MSRHHRRPRSTFRRRRNLASSLYRPRPGKRYPLARPGSRAANRPAR